ncbi:MAG: hypothetical protein V1818_03850 [Candidatus Aenigmatarchaeota archaeon]
MDYNPRTRSLVTRSLAEYRIRKWFKTKKRIEPSPAKLLSQLTKPDDGRSLKLLLCTEE